MSVDRRTLRRWIVAVVLVLLVPLAPFVVLGEAFEARMAAWLDADLSASLLAPAVIVLLAADVFLPVPSSFISTLAGARFGIVLGTAISWLGMTLGACLAFGLARSLGERLAKRLTESDDLDQMQQLVERHGAKVLVFSRALPVLAEAAVLLLGSLHLSWRAFWWPICWANLGLAAAYSVLGAFASEQGQLPLALTASIAFPVVATLLARLFWKPRQAEPT